MDSPEEVSGFHQAGATSLLPIYHFNALAIDALAPRNACVLDLGSGSGQFLSYLSRHRPDLQITGVDLSSEMTRVGRASLARMGLSDRVKLLDGDMRDFARTLQGRIDIVTSVFSLHHLLTQADLIACLREIDRAVHANDASLWIFDFVRPRQIKTAHEVPLLFTPTASPAFRDATRDSLRAAWGFTELKAALGSSVSLKLKAQRSRLLPLYQVHWYDPPRPYTMELLWQQADDLLRQTRREAALFARLFRSAPHYERLRTDAAARRAA